MTIVIIKGSDCWLVVIRVMTDTTLVSIYKLPPILITLNLAATTTWTSRMTLAPLKPWYSKTE